VLQEQEQLVPGTGAVCSGTHRALEGCPGKEGMSIVPSARNCGEGVLERNTFVAL